MKRGEAAACDGGMEMGQNRKSRGARRTITASYGAPVALSVEEFAQVGGGCLHFQLEGGVASHVKGLALMVGMPLVFIGQLDAKGTLDHRHPLRGCGVELVISRFHHADRGFIAFLLETDRFNISVKILVNFQHLFFPVCTFEESK
ncbi:hypothetical protein D3C79_695120 [compost metagenome]